MPAVWDLMDVTYVCATASSLTFGDSLPRDLQGNGTACVSEMPHIVSLPVDLVIGARAGPFSPLLCGKDRQATIHLGPMSWHSSRPCCGASSAFPLSPHATNFSCSQPMAWW